MQRKTARCTTVSEASRITASFPTKIWMILEGGKRSLLVSGADQKEDPLDFVLWKPKKEGEPFWKSPWCDGTSGLAH